MLRAGGRRTKRPNGAVTPGIVSANARPTAASCMTTGRERESDDAPLKEDEVMEVIESMAVRVSVR